jgi:uncharacterized protein (DUF58 family)
MIPPHLLTELRYLEISTARAIRTARVGPYTSRTRGSGFDFDQHLPYRPGDDVRRIDWNVTARVGAPYVRQTHAERELNVVVAMDLSTSMEVGATDRVKHEVLMLVAGSVLFSAAGDQVNVGLLAFSDRVLGWSPPRRASGRTWHLLEELWALRPAGGGTALAPAIRHLQSHLTTTSVIVLVSDFLTDDDGLHSRELRTLAAAHDVVAIVVEDPADAELPAGRGFVRVRDVESRRGLTLALSDRNRRIYAHALAERRRSLLQTCHHLGIEVTTVRAGTAIVQPVIELFARRARG